MTQGKKEEKRFKGRNEQDHGTLQNRERSQESFAAREVRP
jgi:hypothetical protein